MNGLGRVYVPDPRDHLFPMALALSPAPSKRKTRMWRAGYKKLNQGLTGHCVGFAGANWMQALPTYTKVTDTTAHGLYAACKLIDDIPDVEGTYDRALMKVLVGQGRIERYLWAQRMDELIQWLLEVGPVMVGTNWHSGMDDPTREGLVHATGAVRGGHEYVIRGINLVQGIVRGIQSWGPTWGLKGEFWMDLEDLAMLVFRGPGDACSAVEKAAA